MNEIEQAATRHYGQPELAERILQALQAGGKDVNALRPEDLAPVDEFHIRGRAATEELAAVCEPEPGWHVLDVGCGLGGSARYLALGYGCRVTGIDLTDEYVQAARMLTERLGLQERVTFHQGSALAMPFETGAFDLAWSEHAQMNIADKARLYAEIHRVLADGGRFAFHDILQGPGGEPHFPTAWAGSPEYSSLIKPDAFRALLEKQGFAVRYWEDRTPEGLAWFRERVAALRANGLPPLGTHLLVGAVGQEAQENTLRNLEEGRIQLVQGVVQKP